MDGIWRIALIIAEKRVRCNGKKEKKSWRNAFNGTDFIKGS